MAVDKDRVRRLLEEGRRGVRIKVYVKPESRRTYLAFEAGELVFYTEEPPLEGRANASLVGFLARVFNVNPRAVSIVHGHRSRSKVVEIEGLNADTATERLASAVEGGND